MAKEKELVKKISPRHIMGGANELKRLATGLANNGDSLDAFNVFGTGYDIKEGESDKGPWIALLGQFEAQNLITGEVIQATQLFVPDVIANLLAGALKRGTGVQSIDFAFTVCLKRDDLAATGYVYTAKQLLPPDENDPIEKMRKRLLAIPTYQDKQKLLLAGPSNGSKRGK